LGESSFGTSTSTRSRMGLASPSAIPIRLRTGTFAGGVIVEPSRSFLGSGEVAAVCGLLLHS
jgi:hypothetical protein